MFIVWFCLCFLSLYLGLSIALAKKAKQENPKKEPVIDKVCIWYEGNTRADVYEDVKEAFVFTDNNLLRIINNDGSKVYIALNNKGFLRLNVYYQEGEDYTLPEADNLD